MSIKLTSGFQPESCPEMYHTFYGSEYLKSCCSLSLLLFGYVGSGTVLGRGRGPRFQCVVSRTYGRGVGLCVGYKSETRVVADKVPTICVDREVRGALVGL